MSGEDKQVVCIWVITMVGVLLMLLILFNTSCYYYQGTGYQSTSSSRLAQWEYHRQQRYQQHQLNQILFNQHQQRQRDHRQWLRDKGYIQ